MLDIQHLTLMYGLHYTLKLFVLIYFIGKALIIYVKEKND